MHLHWNLATYHTIQQHGHVCYCWGVDIAPELGPTGHSSATKYRQRVFFACQHREPDA